MASDRREGSDPLNSVANRVGRRLRRMFGMENLHDGSREQFEETHEANPEGGRHSTPEAGVSGHQAAPQTGGGQGKAEWSTTFEPFPSSSGSGLGSGGAGGGVAEDTMAGMGAGAAGIASDPATGPSSGQPRNGGAGSSSGSGDSSGGGGGGGGKPGTGATGAGQGLTNGKGNAQDVHLPISDEDEIRTGKEDSIVTGTVIEKPLTSQAKLLLLKEFTIEGYPGVHTPGGKPVEIPGAGTFAIDAVGHYVFTPLPNWNGQVPSIHYTLTDGYSTDQSTLKINITTVDDNFTDNSEKFIYDEDSGKHSGDLLKGSSSPDGQLSISGFSVDGQSGTLGQPFNIPGKGTLTIYSDGKFDFESAPNYNGPIPQASYTVTDGSGQNVQSTLNINVKPVDDNFTDNSEKFIYDEDSGKHSGDLLKGSSSPDGQLSISGFS
ncbi:MAG: hypothetical protein RLZZ54_1394, partial [Cyanobacteriota bacterium]